MFCLFSWVRYLCEGRLFLQSEVLAIGSTGVVWVFISRHGFSNLCYGLGWFCWHLNSRTWLKLSCLTSLATCDPAGRFLTNTDLISCLVLNPNHRTLACIVLRLLMLLNFSGWRGTFRLGVHSKTLRYLVARELLDCGLL